MNEELQPVEEVIESNDEVIKNTETQNEGAELAPAEPEKVVFSDDQQEIFNKAVGKKTHQLRSVERELEEERAKRIELESKQSVAVAPDIPAIPDKYEFDSDEEYHRAVIDRDDKIRQKAEFDNRQHFIEQQNAVNEQNALVESRQVQAKAENALIERADKNGIKQQDLLAAANTVGQFRLNSDIANALVSDQDGDVMIMHLAENPIELDELCRMSPFEAARMIDTVVREKAQKFKPRSSAAPDPSTLIKGGGGSEDSDGFTIE
ncbi:MAG: hypothetical protein KAT90_06250 [Gammaproteobacteria bacterium]|nr:hypothetical protein [Gammaproteobacteria bacterium]